MHFPMCVMMMMVWITCVLSYGWIPHRIINDDIHSKFGLKLGAWRIKIMNLLVSQNHQKLRNILNVIQPYGFFFLLCWAHDQYYALKRSCHFPFGNKIHDRLKKHLTACLTKKKVQNPPNIQFYWMASVYVMNLELKFNTSDSRNNKQMTFRTQLEWISVNECWSETE